MARYPWCMRTMMLLTLLATAAAGQQTRKEITSPATRDSSANDPKAPAAFAVSTQFERVLIFRFKNQTDLLGGLERMAKTKHVRNGVILNALGSVTGYQIHTVSNRSFPLKETYVTAPIMPADIVMMSGF